MLYVLLKLWLYIASCSSEATIFGILLHKAESANAIFVYAAIFKI